MADVQGVNPVAGDQRSPTLGRPGWKQLLALGLFLFAVYASNFRDIDSADTIGATLLPVSIIRGDGPFLDRFNGALYTPDGQLPPFFTMRHGHFLSCYPPGPALLAVPFTLPQVLLLDWTRPGWEKNAFPHCRVMAKNTAGMIAALVGVTLFQLLYVLGLGRVAFPTVLAAALGSDLWVVGSQSLWQHGPAALALSVALLLLLAPGLSRLRFFLAGLATAMLVCCRPIDIIFAATIFLWLVWRHPRGLVWFLPMPVLLGAALLGFNYWYFGALAGGYALLDASVAQRWSSDLLTGAAGTLLSPNRGLFVFTPWIAIALVTVPAVARSLRPWPLVSWLLCALVPYLLVLSMYWCWWGGWSFGPRFWTDAIPLFAILLGASLDWARVRCRPAFWALAAAIVFSVAVQAIGAFCYPSSWNSSPVNVDDHPERLWDWRDSELSRCLTEGIKPFIFSP